MKLRLLSFLFILTLSCEKSPPAQDNDVTKYVDPTIGNVAQFLVPTYPTFHLPNQMVRMFPVKRDYISDEIESFPLQVVAHRRPGVIRMKIVTGEIDKSSWQETMKIDHDLEEYHPWFYSTYLIEDDIRISYVPGKKVGIFKFELPGPGTYSWQIRGRSNLKVEALNPSHFLLKENITHVDRGIFPRSYTLDVYAVTQFSDDQGNPLAPETFSATSDELGLTIETSEAKTVFLSYAISYIDHEQAMENYRKELTDVTFTDLYTQGRETWQAVLGQIQVAGGTEAQKRSFYTSLYRTYERMVDINEGGRYYSAYDGKIHQDDRPFYVDDWVWDTYRATHPLRTIINPGLQNDILNSYTLMYQQSGWMPTFPTAIGNSMCMNSYHSSSIFIDGYRKGLRDYDVEMAYQGIRKNLMEGSLIPWRQGTPRRPIDDFYHKHGFFPALKIGERETEPQMDGFEKRQPVPVTLGVSHDFWALAELAQELDKREEVDYFVERALAYRQLWHPEHRLFIPKDEDANFLDIDPKSAGGPGYREYYDENNGWTYAWDVQHDIKGLEELLGGKQEAEVRLDQLFREPLGMRKNQFYINGSNSTGMVGQFSMGNEPSFHIPYFYNYFGAPWKTQKMTRFLLDVWFKDNIFGIPGDEDGGGMTAFVVFSAIGLYPVVPGLPYYDITSPVFEKITIDLHNGKQFTILAPGASRRKKYIQKALLNGQELNQPFITHKQIMSGATLELVLDSLPNKNWGKDATPPFRSMSITVNEND